MTQGLKRTPFDEIFHRKMVRATRGLKRTPFNAITPHKIVQVDQIIPHSASRSTNFSQDSNTEAGTDEDPSR